MVWSSIRIQLKAKILQNMFSHFQKRLQNIRKKQRMEILALRKKEELHKIEAIRKEIKNIKK